MALLVDQQGEFIDNIEENVAHTVIFVKEGNKNLVSAMKKRSSRRWCLCTSCIVFLLVLGVGIILLVIFGNAAKWWGM